MATGTALLIAAFAAHEGSRVSGARGLKLTAAEALMQQTTESALASHTLVLASGILLNDKRGL